MVGEQRLCLVSDRRLFYAEEPLCCAETVEEENVPVKQEITGNDGSTRFQVHLVLYLVVYLFIFTLFVKRIVVAVKD